ncbi:CBS domain-containing protein [Kaistia adipata]|uniref:CBS domain-containing protein n=1 Tax=Kaistia adipata TaxID=166954 RepID=UPI000419FCAA|nr:CBS domain-containing protein [Kaistia adipata]
MLVESIMTTPVIAILPSMTVREAARLMVAARFGGLPVVSKDGTLVGMVSERDLLRRGRVAGERKSPWWLEWFASVGKTAEDYVEIYERPVEEVMSRNVVTIERQANVDDVADVMVQHQIKRVPVVHQGKVIGIVARTDLLRGLASRMPPDEGPHPDDERIQAEVEAALTRELGGSFVRPRVRDGNVELRGIIFDEGTRAAARAAVQGVAGLKTVTDELVWVEPMAGRVVLC